MFAPSGRVRVYVYGQPADMRKSFDGLYALTKQRLQEDPLSGHVFVFINRRATMLKALYFDRTGFCLWAKRLEQGRFSAVWDGTAKRELSVVDFALLVEGIAPREVKIYRRFQAKTLEAKTSLC